MPRMPAFAEPSTYIRYFGPVLTHPSLRSNDAKLRFIRLHQREAPLKYDRVLTAIAPGAVSTLTTFGDLRMDPKHIAQVFVGVSVGGRMRVFHPFDERILKWDDPTLDIQERDTANVEHEESPAESPRYELWIAPTDNFVPAFDLENIEANVVPRRSLDIRVSILAAKFTYEFVEREVEADIFDKLSKFSIPSRMVTFGGKI